jgi:hypothetical protein
MVLLPMISGGEIVHQAKGEKSPDTLTTKGSVLLALFAVSVSAPGVSAARRRHARSSAWRDLAGGLLHHHDL